MARWLIELQGEERDVREFPRCFPSGKLHAICEAGKYYLVGDAFAVDFEPATVFKMATDAVQELFAIISLLENSARMPSIGNVLLESDDGSRRGYALLSAHLDGRSKLTAGFSLGGAKGAHSRPTQAQLLLAASRMNRNIHIALLLLASPTVTWTHLYRAVEEIETFLGKKINVAGVCSANDRERFTRSANSAEISGNESRHGLGKFVPPDRPMTLAEAFAFVVGVLRRALPISEAGSEKAV